MILRAQEYTIMNYKEILKDWNKNLIKLQLNG